MRVVNANDLLLKETIGKGSFGKVIKTYLDNNVYCLKIILGCYNEDIWNNIKNLTDRDFVKYFITPLSIVKKNTITIGYLTKYYENLIDINKVKENDKIIILLKDAKEKIELLHKEYNLIHGDISKSNLLFDIVNNESYLIDFDSSLFINQKLGSTDSFKLIVKNYYLKMFGLNYDLDKYIFNITTLMILYNYKYIDDLFKDIKSSYFEYIESNKDIVKCSKKLLLNDTKNKYNSDYIIDYY